MSYPVELHPLALHEYVNAYEWYENAQPGLGERFLEAVDIQLGKIAENPQHYSQIKGTYRQVKIPSFPFIIVFRVFPRKKFILICSIHHTSKHPRSKFR